MPTILIIDDQHETRAMYAELFRKHGFRVRTAQDGLEGLSLAKKHLPDVIFTGIVMPRMDGFAMMEALKDDAGTHDIPVAVNSHMGRAGDRDRAERLGAANFIVRDMLPPSEVVERLRALVHEGNTFSIEADPYAADAEALAKALCMDGGALQCPDGQRAQIRVTVTDPTARTATVQFVCE